jgi:hypothetical protein
MRRQATLYSLHRLQLRCVLCSVIILHILRLPDCTYDQPSNRRRNPAPQYIEALEQRLQKTEAVLRSVLPGVDLDDPKFDARGVEQIVKSSKPTANAKKPTGASKPEDEGHLQPMVDRVGSLDLDDQGNWDFHGHSSGFHFMRRFRAQFGEQYLPLPTITPRAKNIQQLIESPKSAQSSPYELNLSAAIDLPPREAAIELCRNAIDDCCALMRPVHRPSFFRKLHSIYDTDPEQYSNDQLKFLPLLYVVMGLGCLFSKTETEQSMLDIKGYKEATEQGYVGSYLVVRSLTSRTATTSLMQESRCWTSLIVATSLRSRASSS